MGKKKSVKVECVSPNSSSIVTVELKNGSMILQDVLAEAAKDTHLYYRGKVSTVLVNGFAHGTSCRITPGDKIQVVSHK